MRWKEASPLGVTLAGGREMQGCWAGGSCGGSPLGERKTSAFSKVGVSGPSCEKLCGGSGRASRMSLDREYSDVFHKRGLRSGSGTQGNGKMWNYVFVRE